MDTCNTQTTLSLSLSLSHFPLSPIASDELMTTVSTSSDNYAEPGAER